MPSVVIPSVHRFQSAVFVDVSLARELIPIIEAASRRGELPESALNALQKYNAGVAVSRPQEPAVSEEVE